MARRRKRRDPVHENTERWLLTYADLITLLLAFFIVMYSMSNLDAKKFGKMSDALNGILHGGAAILPATVRDATPGAGVIDLAQFNTLKRDIQAQIVADDLSDQVETVDDERGLVIRVMESAAFDPGSADLKPQLYAMLTLISDKLESMPNHVRVEGHTDNTPIATARFPSNWELSTTRATRVVRYLVEDLKFDPLRVSALGYGEYRPIATNADAPGRARNRRVDIIVLADEKMEPKADPGPNRDRIALADSLLNF